MIDKLLELQNRINTVCLQAEVAKKHVMLVRFRNKGAARLPATDAEHVCAGLLQARMELDWITTELTAQMRAETTTTMARRVSEGGDRS